MRLIINGKDIELSEKATIARTIQVNDIASPNTRQASYTSTFSIPRTSNNTKALGMLGIIGNVSNIPYAKNEAYLFDDSGFCLVYKGWAVISDTGKDFKCNIYDGIIDFYKAIDNKTLSDLDLTSLQHDKNPLNVVDSYTNSTLPYKYILADYNGSATTGSLGTSINTDYLVPSVKVSWLWEKIEEFTGYSLNGSFKSTAEFADLYMTYPKAPPPQISTNNAFFAKSSGSGVATGTLRPIPNEVSAYDNTSYPALDLYQTLDTTILSRYLPDGSLAPDNSLVAKKTTKLKVTFTITWNIFQTVLDSLGNTIYADWVQITFNNNTFFSKGTSKTVTAFYSVNEGDLISFPMVFNNLYDDGVNLNPLDLNPIYSSGYLELSIKEVLNGTFFENEFKGMSIKQFVSEILWRFNLTMFKDAFSNSYTLKYLSEVVTEPPLDWSAKFVSLNNEKYIYGNYGQRSWIRHKYNDENSTYFDGYFDISNVNLPEASNIIQSSIFVPEFNPSNIFGYITNVYKFWNKEVNNSGVLEFKPLSNRFYFLKAIPKQFNYNLTFTSPTLSESVTFPSTQVAATENFSNLSFQSIVDNYYKEMRQILTQSKVFDVTLRLTEIDIVNIDLSKPVYIKQLGGKFLVNKIQNFEPFKNTKVELIKLSK